MLKTSASESPSVSVAGVVLLVAVRVRGGVFGAAAACGEIAGVGGAAWGGGAGDEVVGAGYDRGVGGCVARDGKRGGGGAAGGV